MKKKKLFVFLFVFIVLFCLTSSCFAESSDDFVVNGEIVVPNFDDIVGDNSQYFIVNKDLSDEGGYRLFVAEGCDIFYGNHMAVNNSSSRFELFKVDYNTIICANNNSGSKCYLRIFDLVDSSWNYIGSYSTDWLLSSCSCEFYLYSGVNSIIYTSFPLSYPTLTELESYVTDGRSVNMSSSIPSDYVDGSVVFQVPPLSKTILAPIVEEVEMSEVMREIVEVLPIVIVAIALLIGLYKALKMLSTVLRQS